MSLDKYKETIFETIKHIDENSNEYWLARNLQKVLEYSEWRNFLKVINRAIISCKSSNINIDNHFVEFNKMVELGSGSKRKVKDFKLSRYACYLIVQNADPSKEVIALGQTYFAIKTRQQELTEEEFAKLSEDEKRLYSRITVTNKNKLLFNTATESGVSNFGKFNNAGYQGLYNGETAKTIKIRKGLKDKEDILDYMGSEELAANLFRITQTDAKLKRDKIYNENTACDTHYKVGRTVRKAIEEIGGTMPEELPTPKKSTKVIMEEELLKIGSKNSK